MVLESIFGKGDDTITEDEFIEITTERDEGKKVDIRIETLKDYRDVEGVQRLLREGNIIFLRIKKMRERDIGELKRSVERLRRTTIAMNGDIIGVDEDFLILSPPNAKIWRGEIEEAKAE
jgi:SepF-like predicted cell division protein (DUF552 family)